MAAVVAHHLLVEMGHQILMKLGRAKTMLVAAVVVEMGQVHRLAVPGYTEAALVGDGSHVRFLAAAHTQHLAPVERPILAAVVAAAVVVQLIQRTTVRGLLVVQELLSSDSRTHSLGHRNGTLRRT